MEAPCTKAANKLAVYNFQDLNFLTHKMRLVNFPYLVVTIVMGTKI